MQQTMVNEMALNREVPISENFAKSIWKSIILQSMNYLINQWNTENSPTPFGIIHIASVLPPSDEGGSTVMLVLQFLLVKLR
mmetsp:Transcript_8661/g.12071  ORF Transcript_8661/g.12071 Transcript_8661/m.12071 type:complete len:82 (+) Transcript_8661:122-367(+)